MNARKLLWIFPILLLAASPVVRALDDLLITEFMAVNSNMLLDEDGDDEDWIELHNAGTNVVNLDGWYLTDTASRLTQWRFPATNLPPNGYLIVFASGKNRRVPGAPLHTNFRLSSSGEYLALIRPDGFTVASSYAPVYPGQVAGVSYGLPVLPTATTLLASGAVARVRIPNNDALASAWTAPLFDDSGWTAVTTGVGYETDGQTAFVPVTVANSVTEFSGTQGQNNWFYGYWDKSGDVDGNYAENEFVTFPNGGGAWSASQFWTGSAWDWFAGDPPFTRLSNQGGSPSGDNGNAGQTNQWAVRRYVSEFNGPLTISGKVTHTSDWVYVTQTGVASSALLYLYLQGAGEGYIDDIKLVAGATPEVGVNVVTNGDFEAVTLAPWTVTANMNGSSLSSVTKHGGLRSLRLVDAAGGSTQSDSIWQSVGVSVGSVYTLSYWYLPVTNNPMAVVRTSGSWLDTAPVTAGDGFVARIFVDGVEVFSQPARVSSTDYSLTLPTRLGSKVDLAIDAGPGNNSLGDNAIFTATLATSDPTVMVVADSVADWSEQGIQGVNNWYYGYYFEGTTTNTPVYRTTNFVAFPRDNGPYGPNNYWEGDSWKWFNGPPIDEIGREIMMPTGLNNNIRHWVIRRWVSSVSGRVNIEWSISKPSADGAGTIGRVLHNGTQRDQFILSGSGADQTYTRTLNLTNVQVGDIIDIALDPTGVGGAYGDGGDLCYVRAVIRGAPSLTRQIASNIQASMRNINASAYLRVPFNVLNPATVEFLTLRLRYDDGFVAYLNGQMVASANAPATPTWNSTAVTARTDAQANQPQEFNLTPFVGLLQPGQNILAIHGLNISASDSDFLLLPELIASSVAVDTNAPRYFTSVTPGAANGPGSTVIGPLIEQAGHSPRQPLNNDPLVVTARVTPTLNPLGAVSLTYRVMFSNEVTIPMFDDGAHGDGLAGDSVFGATIPAAASNPGQMVRYFIYATDSVTNAARLPAYAHPTDSARYYGTVVTDTALTNPLPVLHLFAQDPTQITNAAGTRCSIAYDGEFYDNIFVNLHGQTTAGVFWKQSLNVAMNRGEKFRWSGDAPRVDSFNLLSPISDKSYVRLPLAFETFSKMGVPANAAFPLRVQQNGAFHGVYHFVEKADDNFLDRAGLDPKGSLYKLYLPLTSAYAGVAEKKTRQAEDYSDLQALIDGCGLTGEARRQYLYDNVDIPEVLNFLATIQVVQNEDCCYYKNYFLYRDTEGNREWQMLPWDLDLTFGRTFHFFNLNGVQTNGYFDTNIYWTNLYYLQVRPSPIGAADFIGQDHTVVEALWAVPEIYQMFLRRWSTVQEELLQKPGQHPLTLKFEQRVDELAASIYPDAALDFAKWGNWFPVQTMPVAVDVLKREYFGKRRGWIFNTLAAANGGPYLGTQPSNTVIRLGAIEYNPSSGNQDQEYIELVNTNHYAVDVSGWKLAGAVNYTIKPGVVIPSNSVLYLSPDVNAFRARTSGPRGGLGLFVQGNYQGRLSARGEALQLLNSAGQSVAATNFPGTPSLAQQYLRITEIMYSPSAPPPGLSADADEFEFIELKNIGPVTLDLTGVRLTLGVDFSFTGSAVTSLAPGASVLVVRNQPAFASRYPTAMNVAGSFTGFLDNSGETLRLEDAAGEKILEFAYNNAWYPITDGGGFSLVIVNESADWATWGLKSSWRPSSREQGSPGLANPAADAIAPIFINEVASHTVPPAVDAVELYNPTGSSVDLGGWFLTDDFNTPRKFRIPDGTSIAAGGYLAFNENQFNPTNPVLATSFAFSSKGDEVYLFSATAAGELTGYYHGFEFGGAAAGVNFGRHVNSAGAEQFVAQSANTIPGANAGPKVGPVVISEIHYHPADLASGSDNKDDEFIELLNLTGSPVPLYDPGFATNTWRLRGNVDFDFPAGLALAANAQILIVNFAPTNLARAEAFRARFNVPITVPLLGPYSGSLDNASGELRLSRPDAPLLDGVPYILVDAVSYADAAPWPVAADGLGASLQKVQVAQYGNDPANWLAAAPSAGRPRSAGTAPIITVQPVGQSGLATAPAIFTVQATGTAPLSYQWFLNGDNIVGATNAIYTVEAVWPTNSGLYQVLVFNSAGAALSSNALLNVVYGPYFTVNPTNFGVRAGNVAVFTAAAFGNAPVTYQWLRNGLPAPGVVSSTSSNTTLTLSNVQAEVAGTYVAVATDSTGTVPSRPAELLLLSDPTIVQQPVAQSAVAGATVTFSIEVTNTATLPVGFRWRRNGVSITNGMEVLNGYTSFFTVTNVQSPVGNYSVVVTNAARTSGFTSSSVTVQLLTDTDGDGIPDEWETRYGFASGSAADRNADPDGDGLSNWSEYIAGTDPTNTLSFLKVEAQLSGGGPGLSFGAISNRTYSIEYADGLDGSAWRRLADFLARTNNRIESVIDPAVTTNRFYRVVTPRLP